MLDVLIIGAGPAGTALATRLARDGFTVAIADRSAFPRRKPCGEFLSPQCVPYLDALGLGGVLDELGAQPVAGMRLLAYGARADGRFRQLPGRPAHDRHGYGVRREHFDHRLLQAACAAGASFLPRHEFVALRRDAGGTVVGADLRGPGGVVPVAARWLVGADGVHSKVARALGVQRRLGWLDQFALVAHFDGVPPRPEADVHLLPGGFFAATTVDAGVHSVNLVLPRARLSQRGDRDWDQFVADQLAGAPDLQQRLAGARRQRPWRGIGPFGFTTTRTSLPGAALVGDAAGYVDPLTGEGIYFALFGARALGDALAAALHGPATADHALAGYRRARRRELGPRLFAARVLQRALRWPWLVRAALRGLGRRPALADLVVTMTGDTIHPRQLWQPSFWRAFGAAR